MLQNLPPVCSRLLIEMLEVRPVAELGDVRDGSE